MSEQDTYVVWDTAALKNACVLTGLDGIEDTFKIDEGHSLESEFDNVSIRMDPDLPDDTLLYDVLSNPYSMIIASEQVVALLKDEDLKKVEYLPISVIDHKGHVVPDAYFVVHPIEHVDCLDVEASGVEWDFVDDTIAESVGQIVLDRELVDTNRKIIRPKPFIEVVLIDRGLAQKLDKAGVQGCEWIELTDYVSI